MLFPEVSNQNLLLSRRIGGVINRTVEYIWCCFVIRKRKEKIVSLSDRKTRKIRLRMY